MSTRKPLAVVYDPHKGGEKLEVIKRMECPETMRAAVFPAFRKIIEWHRIVANSPIEAAWQSGVNQVRYLQHIDLHALLFKVSDSWGRT